MDAAESREAVHAVRAGQVRLLFVSPERIALDSPQFAVLCARADAAAASGRIEEAAAAYEEIINKAKYDTPWAAPEQDLRSAQRLVRLLRTLTSLYVQAGDEAKAAAIRQRQQELARVWEAKLPGNPVVASLATRSAIH